MLKNKIPPPIITLILVIAVYYSTWIFQAFNFKGQELIAITILTTGLGFTISAISLFRKNQTTVNPMTPHKSTKLVTSGVYQYTRNPMYLGLLLVLASSTVFFGAWLGIIICFLFILVMVNLQILPEEKALEEIFGEVFLEYKSKVRRWI